MIRRIRKSAMCITRTIHSYRRSESQMTKKIKKCFVCLLRVFKCLRSTITRFRKSFMRKCNMRQLKVALGVFIMTVCFITLLCYWYRSSMIPHQQRRITSRYLHRLKKYVKGTPFSHVNLNTLYKNEIKTEGNDSLELDNPFIPARIIDTPGCKIPLNIITNWKTFKNNQRNASCGKRVVFLKKIGIDKVQVFIKARYMKKYLRKSMVFDCCYRFLQSSMEPGNDEMKIRFTTCKRIYNGETITLGNDFINVKCFEYDKQNISFNIYDDVYPFVKKINITDSNKSSNCKHKYNVLMIGIDSMSLPRFEKTMQRTSSFFKENFWSAFRAYHKVAGSAYPNIMATLTGKDFATLTINCSSKMDQCTDLLIWSKFKQAGYVTAYGEDFHQLPDTFSNPYAFHKPPADHYMRPFFVNSETAPLADRSLVCAGKLPSGQQLLNYALDFASTYRMESFFGLFWINSFSQNPESQSQDGDKILENFLNQLSYTGVLFNTFVVVFSDHGIRFGKNRLEIAGYYDERLPFLFMWVPLLFKGHHGLKFTSIEINQFRLLTPYDLYNTLMDVNRISTCSTSDSTEVVSEACPKCQSLFNVISANRTCHDAAINEKWCSCHNLYPLLKEDAEGMKAVSFVVSEVQKRTQLMANKRCWVCVNPLLKNIIRIGFYYEKEKTTVYYVIAFTMTPIDVSYEATVKRKGGKMELVGDLSVISRYKSFGNCTIKASDRRFCVCQRIQNCEI